MAHLITRSRNFSYQLLESEFTSYEKTDKNINTLIKAYRGDYWQNGQGSLLPPSMGVNKTVIDNVIEKRFVYRNVIKELVERVSQAFFGRSPNWTLESGGTTITDPALELTLGEIWTQKNLSKVLAKAFETRLVAKRGGIRIFIPAKYVVDGIVRPFNDVYEALKAIEVEFIEPENSKLLKDDGSLFSMIRYKVIKDWDTKQYVDVIEFSFVDDNDMTYLGTVTEQDSKASGPLPITQYIRSSPLNLNGKTLYNEFNGEEYVSMSVYRNNQLVNLALTCAGFSLVDNGFGEMVLTNVALETVKVTDPDTELGYREIPKTLKRGGGVVNNLIGISQVNEETGAESIMSPGVHFKQPTPLDSFKEGKDLAYRTCLEETKQLYSLISGDAAASGESRIQAMQDFHLKVSEYKPEVDEMGSWLLTTMIRFASAIVKDTVYSEVVATYDSKIFVSDLSPQDRQFVITKYKEGLISLETTQQLLGVEDPELEKQMIVEERGTPLREMSIPEIQRRLDLISSMIGVFPPRVSYQFLGLSSEEIAAIEAMNAEDQAIELNRMLEQERLARGLTDAE